MNLKLLNFSHIDKWGHKFHNYECVCGNIVKLRASKVNTGKQKSCGCLKRSILSTASSTHGMSKTLEFKTWSSMKTRCYNPKADSYEDYGGRGITVCDEWLNSFETFYKDMGNKPYKNAQIDRIDNSKEYSKNNCKWVSCHQNNRNKRNNKILTYKGNSKSLAEWAEMYGLRRDTLLYRINANWSVEKALTRKVSR